MKIWALGELLYIQLWLKFIHVTSFWSTRLILQLLHLITFNFAASKCLLWMNAVPTRSTSSHRLGVIQLFLSRTMNAKANSLARFGPCCRNFLSCTMAILSLNFSNRETLNQSSEKYSSLLSVIMNGKRLWQHNAYKIGFPVSVHKCLPREDYPTRFP